MDIFPVARAYFIPWKYWREKWTEWDSCTGTPGSPAAAVVGIGAAGETAWMTAAVAAAAVESS